MNVFSAFNFFEAMLWFLIAIIFFVASASKKLVFVGSVKTSIFLGAIFVLFGISDLIEIQTGTWWRPWWLLLLNSFCVISIVLGIVNIYRLLKSPDKNPQTHT